MYADATRDRSDPRFTEASMSQRRLLSLGLASGVIAGCSTIFGIDVPPLEQGLGEGGMIAASAGTGDVDGAMSPGGTSVGETSPAGGDAGSVGGTSGGGGRAAAGRSAAGGGAHGGRGGSAGTSAGSGGLGQDSPFRKQGSACADPGALA